MLDRIREAVSKFTSKKKIDKRDLEELIKEIQRALILGDVNIKIVFEISEEIKKKIFEEKPENISLRDYTIKTIYEVLTKYLGKGDKTLELKKQKILLVGLYGTGKTTTAAKLGNYFKKRGLSVCLVCADVHRAGAYHQLKQLAEKIGVGFYGQENEKKVINILKKALQECKEDVIIVDSAGRDNVNEDLLKEIKEIHENINPDEILLVISADIGSIAKDVVEKFKETLPITGIIITKMDTSAKAGGALVSSYLTNAPILFIGTGEKIEDFEKFDSKRFVSRLLGMGDLETLLEKVKELEEEQKTIKEMIEKGEYNMYVFYEQLKATQKMGSFQKIMEMIPGMNMLGVKKEEIEEQEEKVKKWKYIFDSMTKEERLHPEIINSSRIARIAKGSGTKEEDVREMLKAYKMSEKIFKGMKSGKLLKDPRMKKILKMLPKDKIQGIM